MVYRMVLTKVLRLLFAILDSFPNMTKGSSGPSLQARLVYTQQALFKAKQTDHNMPTLPETTRRSTTSFLVPPGLGPSSLCHSFCRATSLCPLPAAMHPLTVTWCDLRLRTG